MYFTVKYIEFPTFEKMYDVDEKCKSLNDDMKKTLVSKNKELLVNPDCLLAIIMDYIFNAARIHCDRTDFDMITKKGKLLNIKDLEPDSSGLDVFQNRGTYYITFCKDTQNKPLLCKKSKEFSDLFEANKKSKESLKKTRRSTIVMQDSSGGIGSVDLKGKVSSAGKSKTSLGSRVTDSSEAKICDTPNAKTEVLKSSKEGLTKRNTSPKNGSIKKNNSPLPSES